MSDVALGGGRWTVEAVTSPAPGKDQDAVLVAPDFVAVADGSTPMADAGGVDVRAFAEKALADLAGARERPVEEMFRSALERADRAPSVELGGSCTVGLVRTLEDEIEAALLGDCLIVAAGEAGTEVVEDERLEPYDLEVAHRIADAYRAGEPEPTRLPEVLADLRRHRSLANREDTYWLFAGDPRAADHVLSRRLDPRAGAILLCSDGFARLVEPLRVVRDHRELVERALDRGLASLADELRAAEAEDGSMVRAPRLSVHDDASAVLLRRAG